MYVCAEAELGKIIATVGTLISILNTPTRILAYSKASPLHAQVSAKMSAVGSTRIATATLTADRVTGVLLGLACGDAVGCTSEMQTRGKFPPVTDMHGGGAHRLDAGQWTDDTSLALCLAQSFIEKSRHDPRDQLSRYLGWREEGRLSSTGKCFDIGNSTSSSLEKFRDSNCTRNYCGSTHASMSGNGSIMRLGPVPMLLHAHPELAIQVSGESSRTTHASRACVDSCRYFAGLVVGAIDGESKEKLLATGGFVPRGLPEDYWSSMSPPLEEGVAEVVLGASHAHREPPDEEAQKKLNRYMPQHERRVIMEKAIHNSGYVVRSLEAALWAFGRSSNFEEGCLMVANLGDDADTVAAIYGQIAGAYYGASEIPSRWRNNLALQGLIETMAEELYDMSLCIDPNPPLFSPPDALLSISENSPDAVAASADPPEISANVHSAAARNPEHVITHFAIKSTSEEAEGVKTDSMNGRDKGMYWRGGVAAHYKRLEDGYITIQRKMQGYENMDAYRQDVEVLLQQHGFLSADHGIDEHVGDVGAPASEKREVDEVSSKRKSALTAEFAKRFRR